MSKLTPLIIFYLFLTSVQAQNDLSLGFYGGTSQYMGDMNKMNPLFSPSPAFGFGIKADQGLRYSFHLMGSYNPLRGSTKYVDDYHLDLQDTELKSFTTSQIDFSLTTEFNFLPYESYDIRKRNFTPYVFAGLGTSYFLSGQLSEFPVTIPFGLGIKYNIFERFSIGIQWTAKKIFYDNMDGVVNVSEEGNPSKMHNDDWYHHSFIFVTFKPFREAMDCPAYEQ